MLTCTAHVRSAPPLSAFPGDLLSFAASGTSGIRFQAQMVPNLHRLAGWAAGLGELSRFPTYSSSCTPVHRRGLAGTTEKVFVSV